MVQLRYKIALTYLLVTAVVVLAVITTAGIRTPLALEHHIKAMQTYFTSENHLEEDLKESFTSAIREVVISSLIIAVGASILLTVFLSRRVVNPILELTQASIRIADGQLDMRVKESGNDELTLLAGSFNRMARDLESTENRRLRLIGDAAHELRTPLTGIISIMEGISDGVFENTQEMIDHALYEADRMKKLVSDLEELSRLSADTIKLNNSTFDLQDHLESTIRSIRPQFEGKDIQLYFHSRSRENTITTDKGRLSQILLNLLTNAFRYTPEGGTVRITLSRKPSGFDISVQDSGIGIPPLELDKIFERFYRIDPSRNRSSGGSGIGLAVSLRLARFLQGNLTASSQGTGKGSTFTLNLPEFLK